MCAQWGLSQSGCITECTDRYNQDGQKESSKRHSSLRKPADKRTEMKKDNYYLRMGESNQHCRNYQKKKKKEKVEPSHHSEICNTNEAQPALQTVCRIEKKILKTHPCCAYLTQCLCIQVGLVVLMIRCCLLQHLTALLFD